MCFLLKSLFFIIFKSNILKPAKRRALNTNKTLETIKRVKTVPTSDKSIFSSINPKSIVGKQNSTEYKINFRYLGFSTHFFLNSKRFNIVVKPKTKVKPTSREYIPQTLGKNHILKNINAPLIM